MQQDLNRPRRISHVPVCKSDIIQDDSFAPPVLCLLAYFESLRQIPESLSWFSQSVVNEAQVVESVRLADPVSDGAS